MFTRNTLVRRAILLAAGMMLGLAAAAVEAKNYVLRYSDIGPPRGPRAEALMWWADELEKRTNGQVKIEFFWSQSLVKGKETLKAVGSGLAEAGTIIGVYTPADLPIWNYANAPFGNKDPWVGMRTWWELRQTVPELKAETAKKNVHILFNNTTGPVQLLSRDKITDASGLSGKKVRTTGGWTQLMEGLGAVPVSIGFGELYQALDRGTIDATINYTPFVKSYKHFEVAGYVLELSMGQLLGYGAGINMKLWQSMPEDLRKTISDVSDQYMDVYAEKYIKDERQSKADLIAGIDGKKVEFINFSDDELDKMKNKAGVFTTEWKEAMAKKGFDADGFVAKFEAIRAKYEKEVETKGYPWER